MKLKLIIIGFTLILLSCEKMNPEQNNYNVESNVLWKDNIDCKNGILIFKDYASLSDFESKANLMELQELAEFEISKGFVSQKRIFENIALKEYELQIVPYEGKSEAEMKNIPFPGHCPEYFEAIKSGVIKEINEIGGSYIDYNLTDRSMAVYLNIDGLVMVGDVLYYVRGNTIKSLKNATIYSGQKLINDENTGTFETLENRSVMSGTYTAYMHDAGNGDWVTVGNFRTKMSGTYIIKTFGTNAGTNWSKYMQCYPLSVGTNSQRKNDWGNWNQYWGPQTINGNASLKLEWSQNYYGPYNTINGINSNFSTYYYLPSASNATVKYHPITGASAASIEYVIVEAPYNGYYSWGIKPISFNITANLPGGCCGFTRQVIW